MTREAKIGMLTGLCVIVLIGVLLSNYLGQNPSGAAGGRMSGLPVGQAYRDQLTQPITVPAAPSESRGNSTVVPPTAYAMNNSAAADPTSLNAGQPTMQQPVAPTMDGVVLAKAPTDPVTPPTFQLPDMTKTMPVSAVGPQPPAKVAAPAGKEYQIVAGDSLQKIAYRFYKSSKPEFVKKIVSANPAVLKDEKTMLVVGKKLLIPDLPAPTIAADAPKPTVDPRVAKGPAMVFPPGSTGTEVAKGGDARLLRADSGASFAPPKIEPRKEPTVYVIKAGDTIGAIAAKYVGTGDKTEAAKMVKKIMALNKITDAGSLQVGQKITLPAKT